MRICTWSAIITLSACGPEAPPTTPANRSDQAPGAKTRTVSVPPFGDIAIEDGGLALMDHNSGDQRVHVLTVSRDGHGAKLSWADNPGPRKDVASGTFPIAAEERTHIQEWSKQLWQLAPAGRRSFPRPSHAGKPGYEWAFVLRRGDEVRVIEGGESTGSDSQPDIIEGIVDFLDMHF